MISTFDLLIEIASFVKALSVCGECLAVIAVGNSEAMNQGHAHSLL
jgi:hypothetical protein